MKIRPTLYLSMHNAGKMSSKKGKMCFLYICTQNWNFLCMYTQLDLLRFNSGFWSYLTAASAASNSTAAAAAATATVSAAAEVFFKILFWFMIVSCCSNSIELNLDFWDSIVSDLISAACCCCCGRINLVEAAIIGVWKGWGATPLWWWCWWWFTKKKP